MNKIYSWIYSTLILQCHLAILMLLLDEELAEHRSLLVVLSRLILDYDLTCDEKRRTEIEIADVQ